MIEGGLMSVGLYDIFNIVCPRSVSNRQYKNVIVGFINIEGTQ